MARPREPINLQLAKGRVHMSAEDIEQRRSEELPCYADNIQMPRYLNKAQQARFTEISNELIRLGIFGNLDVDTLGRYLVAQTLWERYAKLIRTLPKKSAARKRELLDKLAGEGKKIPDAYADAALLTDEELSLEVTLILTRLMDKFYQQAEASASKLGLNITSRCRLVIPKPQEAPRPNKFDRFVKRA